jgi:outer membrane protein
MQATTPFFAAAALALLTGIAAAPAAAQSAGDILVRGGWGHVQPNDDSGDLSSVPGGKVDVKSDGSVALTLAYLVTDRIGVELVGALPFQHDVHGAGALAGAGKVAETKQLPPTVLLQYYFNPQGGVRPYVGAGINYTTFFDEQGAGALAAYNVKLDDSWGLAAEAGVDIDLGGNWFANLAVWYMDIDTKATISGGALAGTVNVQIDPWVGFVGVGYRF